jgi:methylated-DNA-[protein]-cysteine S-methyltransferase
VGSEFGLECLLWEHQCKNLSAIPKGSNSVLEDTKKQLAQYLEGKRKVFHLKLAPNGTWFQKAVWHEVSTVPFGKKLSYGELAQHLGSSQKARAVGMALSRNPIPLIVPCHRVVGAKGNLGGFSGGTVMKSFLLDLEGSL